MDFKRLICLSNAVLPISALFVGCETGTSGSNSAVDGSTCVYREGAAETLIIGSTLLLPDASMDNGGVVVLPSGKLGEIAAFEEASATYPDASVLDCRGTTVLSPGWINVHEHEAYSYAFPDPGLSPVYQHREEWIFGRNNLAALPIPADRSYDASDVTSLAVLAWVELRHIFAGTTTLGGPGAVPGLAKNIGRRSKPIDTAAYDLEADLEIFPFSIDSIERFASRCEDSAVPLATLATPPVRELAYAPHVGEGRKSDCTAVSELDAFVAHAERNQSSGRRYSAVHAVAASSQHLKKFSDLDITLVWSPRSNLNLYGETIDLKESMLQGVRLALATDWSPSGSFNMLEELQCAQMAAADQSSVFDAQQLWSMATADAAYAVGIEDVTGQLRPGLQADLVLIENLDNVEPYAAAVNAQVDDVLAVWIDGRAAVADATVVEQLNRGMDCVAAGPEGKQICANFASLGISWDDIVALSRELVPISGDASNQSLCLGTTSLPNEVPAGR